DGIRDRNVTGVQTCALPIFAAEHEFVPFGAHARLEVTDDKGLLALLGEGELTLLQVDCRQLAGALAGDAQLLLARQARQQLAVQIGRASCRERLWVSVLAG